jgi:hypothetical protein
MYTPFANNHPLHMIFNCHFFSVQEYDQLVLDYEDMQAETGYEEEPEEEPEEEKEEEPEEEVSVRRGTVLLWRENVMKQPAERKQKT